MDYNLPVILSRSEHQELVDTLKARNGFFESKNILITGSEGSLGLELQKYLKNSGANVVTVDIAGNPTLQESVTDSFSMRVIHDHVYRKAKPLDYIFHLAADKHAPHAETRPGKTVDINILGLTNIMSQFPEAHMILTSTCKAIDPETVYGATKLIAERIVLDRGGSVARFYNVPETQGNVFEIWDEAAKASHEPLKVMPCHRYFISKAEAVGLLVAMPQIPAGRYTIGGVVQRNMIDLAAILYPGRAAEIVPQRRGDRTAEPLHAQSEELQKFYGGIVKVVSIHDKPI